ncbi:DUF1767-domain-containing protein [Cristinia sonorae]|uniref:RecQ-mediated genome instability protein 1 n=1 Tax=Cristinia sonorae TaxID=1940300 RepID=A0A8K0UPM3_9AGAR|nr:DUF1767-domain-containing protein [Cristinia sonorae]
MDPPRDLVAWLKRKYPRPTVAEDWLRDCYAHMITERNLRDEDEIYQAVEDELLRSDLCDSMLPGTGLPENINELDGAPIPGSPIMVEILSMEEVGHSAFSLLNVMEARSDDEKERAKREAAGEEEDEDAEQMIKPKFPRSMLRFLLSDGFNTIQAFEYAPLPEIEFGETPLGHKVNHCFLPWTTCSFVSRGSRPSFSLHPLLLAVLFILQ